MSPKKYGASLFAIAVVVVVGCNTTGFRGIPKAQKAVPTAIPAPKESDANKTPAPAPIPVQSPLPPKVDTKTPAPLPPVVGPVPGKLLHMQIAQLQPEAWWNNCLKVSLGDQTVDMGCTKDASPLKVARFTLPQYTTCVDLKVEVGTFKNMGNECVERAKMGLACEGPYPAVADFIRSPSESSQLKFFKFEKTSTSAQALKVSFEDQDEAALESAAANPQGGGSTSSADELGIDFNDLVFEVQANDLKVGILGSSFVCSP